MAKENSNNGRVQASKALFSCSMRTLHQLIDAYAMKVGLHYFLMTLYRLSELTSRSRVRNGGIRFEFSSVKGLSGIRNSSRS